MSVTAKSSRAFCSPCIKIDWSGSLFLVGDDIVAIDRTENMEHGVFPRFVVEVGKRDIAILGRIEGGCGGGRFGRHCGIMVE